MTNSEVQRTQTLFDSSPDAMIAISPEGKVLHWNQAAQDMFGYTAQEALNRSLVELIVPPERAKDTKAAIGDTIDTGLKIYGSARRRDGSVFPTEISLSPLEMEEGSLVMAAVRDITEQRKAQEEIKRKNAELEEQNQRVQEANRLKTVFLANMSHELRTPLNSIIGFSEFLKDKKPGPLNEKQEEYLGDVLTSARHLLQLINDVLDLAKVEAGKMDLALEAFSVGDAVAEVCAVIGPTAKKKNISVNTKLAGDIGLVTLDQQKFKQILYNLLSNAVKFTGDGGMVSLAASRKSQDRFQFQVSDTGIGIKQEDIGKLFTEFQQLDSSASRHYEGTGLGLALTKKLVELHQGSIELESEPGVGSVFRVVLPISAGGQ
jgi:PAS domain S-box-containing protein